MALVPEMQRFAGNRPGTTYSRGADFRDPRQRQVKLNVSMEYFNLPTLPERMFKHLIPALVFHVRDAAEATLSDAQMQLQPGHGYDTGLMYDTLVAKLVDHLLETGVYYDLMSEQAYYWRWVEFGHWMVNGEFWEGYHFLENALRMNEDTLRRAVREAYADVAVLLAGEARASAATGGVGGLPV